MGYSVLCTQYHCPWLVLCSTIHVQAGRGHSRKVLLPWHQVRGSTLLPRVRCLGLLGSGPYWLSWDAHGRVACSLSFIDLGEVVN